MFYPSMYENLEEAIDDYEREYNQRPEDQKFNYLDESFIQVFPDNAKKSIEARIEKVRDYALSAAADQIVRPIIAEVRESLIKKDTGEKVQEDAEGGRMDVRRFHRDS